MRPSARSTSIYSPIPAQSRKQEHRDGKAFPKVEMLVVCDMLLTGFDAPFLQALYLDKVAEPRCCRPSRVLTAPITS